MPTQLEIAELRIKCFKLFDGWGRMVPVEGKPDKFEATPLAERMKIAWDMAAWALQPADKKPRKAKVRKRSNKK